MTLKSIHMQGVSDVSQLIMGSDYFTPERIDEVSEILDAYVRIGGNTIDTAYIYCGGKSEQAIGMWIAERGNREQIRIWTKGGHPDENGSTINRQAIKEQLQTSLERLQTDYVDLYALHRDDRSVPVGEIIEILNEHVEAGTMKCFGVSNWTHDRIQEANAYAAEHGLAGISFNSPNLSLAKAQEPYWHDCVSADESVIDWHREHQLPLLSWSAQARGFFTGKYSPDNRENTDLVRVFYNDDNWERYRRAEQLAAEKGFQTIQIALAYVLNQSFPTCAIIGPQNEAEMQSCAVGASIVLTPDEIDWLDLRKKG